MILIPDDSYFASFFLAIGVAAELSAVLPLGNTAGPFTSTVSTSSGNNTMVTNGTSNSHGDTSNGIITGIVSDGSNGFDITCQLPPNATTTEKTGEKMSYEDDMTNILYEVRASTIPLQLKTLASSHVMIFQKSLITKFYSLSTILY